MNKFKLKKKYSVGLIFILFGVFFNPFLITPWITLDAQAEPFFNYLQIFFIQIYLISLGILIIKRYNFCNKNKYLLFLSFIISILIFLSLENNLQARVIIPLLCVVLVIIYIKRNLIINYKKEIAVLLTVIILLFFALEVFSRIYLMNTKALDPKYGNNVREFSKAGILQKSDYDSIVWELKPNLDTRFALADLKTNSKGLNDREYPLKKPLNTYRIAVVGDSVTMPIGVNIDDSYHGLLEEWYNNESDEIEYEFINFGVGGYDLRQYLAVIKYKALEYEPDHILIGVLVTNDFEIKNFSNFEIKKRRTNSYIRIWSFKLFKDSFFNFIEKFYKGPKPKSSSFEEVKQIFSELSRVRDENNVTISFVALNRVEEKRFFIEEFEMLVNLTDEFNFELLDAEYKFEGIPHIETQIYRMDPHGNEMANRLFAEAIKENWKIPQD